MQARRLPPLIAAGVLLLVAGAASASEPSREWVFQDEEDLFLRGCRLDRKCAVARHAKLLDFRRDHPEVYRNLTSGGIDGMIGMGAVLLNGVTCSGNVVFLVRNRLFDWDRSMLELLQWQVYNHETIFHYAPAIEKGIVVVQDVSDFSLKSMWQIARSGGLGLLNYFDQHIVGIVLVGEPWFFASFWRVARMLLPEKERNMVHMLGNRWHEIPQAVQIGRHDQPVCGGGELGPVERSLAQLPSDGDLGGVPVGSLPLNLSGELMSARPGTQQHELGDEL